MNWYLTSIVSKYTLRGVPISNILYLTMSDLHTRQFVKMAAVYSKVPIIYYTCQFM